ncbi:MAG: DUF6513 domain-containing protein [Candidatus Eutrophobiaceae bacterium]
MAVASFGVLMAPAQERILFLTGHLAHGRLVRVLEEMPEKDFDYVIRDIGVSVAALMTAQMIARRLAGLEGVDRVVVPGLCRGNLQETSQILGIPCERGPIDVRDLPVFLGGSEQKWDLDSYDVLIFAELTDAPLRSVQYCLDQAADYRLAGADVIDVGCLPDTKFSHMEELIAALREQGYAVSVDSLDTDDLLRGGRAGADYLLSLSESSLWIADEVASTPILIPEPHGDMPSLHRAMETMDKRGRACYADPILDPIHFGFTESLSRYRELRKVCPDAPIMMGVGNLTELTEADTTGINALLFGIISELGINAVLHTQVSPHCRTAIREADCARRIMAAAKREGSIPKGVNGGLLAVHQRRNPYWEEREIREIYEQVRDPGYRIQLSSRGMHVYNRDGIWEAKEPFELFPQLGILQEDAPHAFYMGVELARAQIAWQLGKTYTQDVELDWGVAWAGAGTSEEDAEQLSQAVHNMKEFRKMSRKRQPADCKTSGSTLPDARSHRKKATGDERIP